ncbi:MAG: hypothetical protein IGS50_02470 [Synechococcales cyanobacterium C42_A2020_086]|jgi:hypothetical protein|nr:hypothetical protein [Synechococcales cyanobacterium M58_A2018_015]MBF2072618.1 hypothetical protein [Synechococcales cyanobacterium C42_A2020_086]
MKKWTSCQYDDSLHLVSVTIVEGGINPRQQVIRRSQEYENDHKGCAAIEVEGGFENCPIGIQTQDIDQFHCTRGK